MNNVGMMDQAYFVGRAELLDFFNTLLGLNLAKIEDTASGAVACQLTDYIFPGSVPMSRVNWEARYVFFLHSIVHHAKSESLLMNSRTFFLCAIERTMNSLPITNFCKMHS
jgi:hypothetical protein